MVTKTIPIALDLKRVTSQPLSIPTLVEGDNGNIIVITLTDDGSPVDLSACKVYAVFSKVSDGSTSEQDTQDAFISLQEYGLALTGTPSNSDTITVTSDGQNVSATTTVTGGSVTIDKDTWLSKISAAGTYTVTYVSASTSWKLGNHSVTISGTSHNIITINLKTSSYGAGKNNVELQVYSGTNYETLVTTAQFNFDARKGIFNEDTVRTSSEYPILASLIRQVQQALALALPFGDVSASAQSGNAAGVSVTVDEDSVTFSFTIPNGVYVGNDDPPADTEAEVWIIPGGEGGDPEGTFMSTEVYDQDNDGIVDNAEKLGGELPSYYATSTGLSNEITNRQNAINTEVSNRNSAISSAILNNVTNKLGAASGIATLDSAAKIPAYQSTAHVVSIEEDTTLALAHNGGFLNTINTSDDITITVPAYASVEFPVDSEIIIHRYGSKGVTIAAGGGVTICTSVSPITIDQYKAIGLKKIGADVWAIFGL